MDTFPAARTFGDVVLVADMVADPAPGDGGFGTRRDLEQTEASTLAALLAAIGELGIGVTHYTSPQELANSGARHQQDIVLSVYGGGSSRNRMALVPAVCESLGLRFIGPDTYGRIIAQDKEVSKRLALDCGLRTPSWRVVRNAGEVSAISSLALPCVAKPLLEGSSIGITQDNLVRDPATASDLVMRLLADFGQSVLIEEFVSGRETSFCAIQRGSDLDWAYSEVVVDGQPGFFEQRLFDVEEKQTRTPGRTVRNIDGELSPEDLQCMLKLLEAYGPFGYCRVDGRHRDGAFHFLELTPDAWLHPHGQFAMAFTERGWSYRQVLSAVLSSAG